MTSTVRAKMAQQEKEKKVAQRLSENPVEMVRARNKDGHFVKDDPSTPENEAWVEKPKATKKPVAAKRQDPRSSKEFSDFLVFVLVFPVH